VLRCDTRPGSAAELAASLGDRVCVIDASDPEWAWCHLGKEGWVHRDALSAEDNERPASEEAPRVAAEESATISTPAPPPQLADEALKKKVEEADRREKVLHSSLKALQAQLYAAQAAREKAEARAQEVELRGQALAEANAAGSEAAAAGLASASLQEPLPAAGKSLRPGDEFWNTHLDVPAGVPDLLYVARVGGTAKDTEDTARVSPMPASAALDAETGTLSLTFLAPSGEARQITRAEITDVRQKQELPQHRPRDFPGDCAACVDIDLAGDSESLQLQFWDQREAFAATVALGGKPRVAPGWRLQSPSLSRPCTPAKPEVVLEGGSTQDQVQERPCRSR